MHRGTRKGRIYADIWKRLPIKMAPLEQQKEIALLVGAIQEAYKKPVRVEAVESTGTLMNINALFNKIEQSIEEIYGINIAPL